MTDTGSVGASALQNAVQAINTLSQTWTYTGGTSTSPAYSANTLITPKAGRVAYVSVIDGGSVVGYIHNCPTIAAASDSNKLYAIPTTAGVYLAASNFNNGLVIKPGTGQLVTVTYSLAQNQTATI